MRYKWIATSWGIILYSMLIFSYPSTTSAYFEEDFFEQSEILVNLQFRDQKLEDNLFIYKHGNVTYVPLGYFINILDFPIQGSTKSGVYSGWFIKQDRIFQFDFNKRSVTTKNGSYQLKADDAFSYQGDIYVDTKLIEQWFPLTFELAFQYMVLVFTPTEHLPAEQKIIRAKMQEKLRSQNKDPYPYLKTAYKRFDYPFIDIQLNGSIDKNDPEGDVSIRSVQDFMYHTAHSFVSVNEEGESNVELYFEKADKDRGLLGPLNASFYEFGDIQSVSIPLVDNLGSGAGIKVTNADITNSQNFDKRTFEGTTNPGWEVELYHNDILIDFIVVGNDGRYRFIDVPLLFGENHFMIVSYGPQGQREEEHFRANIDESFIPSGQFEYLVMADAAGQRLIPIDDNDNQPDGFFGLATLGYGISEKLSLFTALNHYVDRDGGLHNVSLLSIRRGMKNFVTNFDLAYDISDAYSDHPFAFGWGLNGALGDISVRSDLEYLSYFTENTKNKSELSYEVDLSGQTKLGEQPLSYRTSSEIILDSDDRTEFIHSNSLSTTINRIYISHELEGRWTHSPDSSIWRLDGDVGLRGRYNDISLKGNVFYGIHPDFEPINLDLELSKRILKETELTTFINQSLQTFDQHSVGISFSTLFPEFILDNSFQYNSQDDNFSYNVGIQFSLQQNPLTKKWKRHNRSVTNTANVITHAYHDMNQNFSHDKHEPTLGATFYSNATTHTTDAGKKAIIYQVPTYSMHNIHIDSESIIDPIIKPSIEGRAIFARPGETIEMDFPVTTTGEIDGTVTLNGAEAKYVTLQLINSNGDVVKKTKTEIDGFYLFNDVGLGQYTIAIHPLDNPKLPLNNILSKKVRLDHNNPIASFIDLTLTYEE